MKLLRISLLSVVFVLSVSATCFGQPIGTSTAPPSSINASAQDDDLLKLLEITKIQRDGAIESGKLKDDRLQAKDATIKAHEGTIAGLEEQLKEARKALAARTEVNTGDAAISVMANKLIEQQNKRINELEHPSLLSSIFDRRTLSGAIVGFAACKVTNGGTTNPISSFTNGAGFGQSQVQFAYPQPYPLSMYQAPRAEAIIRNALKGQ